MKKLYFPVLSAAMLAISLLAEDPVLSKNFVLVGGHKLELNKTASLYLAPANIVVEPYLLSTRWTGFHSRDAVHKMTSDGNNGLWQYDSTLPAASAPVQFETVLSCPQGAKSVKYSCKWKAADAKDIKEVFVYIQLPLASITGKNFIVNGKDVPVVSENKFAWFTQAGKPVTLTLFPGDPEREITFRSTGNIRMSCETHLAAKRSWIRLYPVSPESGIELEITAK